MNHLEKQYRFAYQVVGSLLVEDDQLVLDTQEGEELIRYEDIDEIRHGFADRRNGQFIALRYLDHDGFPHKIGMVKKMDGDSNILRQLDSLGLLGR